MQKKILFLIALFFSLFQLKTFAFHLKGGWIQYEYLSSDSTAKTHKYRITVHQYLSCTSSGQQIDADVILGIFDGSTNAMFRKVTISLTSTDFPSITTFDPCITPTPAPGAVCYRIDHYVTTVDLPFNDNGYQLAVQRCCRIGGIINLVNSDALGVTYYNRIPGKIFGQSYSINSSPVFEQRDTVIICHNTPFVLDFAATDADGDSLVYSFCDGLHGGSQGQSGAKPDPPANPPYTIVDYATGYNGSFPMGSNVVINPKTGAITGIAPDPTGDYVIAVCVSEIRNGVVINRSKKEIHVNVANCELSAASLKPTYITCNGFDMQFQNESHGVSVSAYKWDFGVKSITTDTSSNPTPTWTYSDTGQYLLTLVVSSKGCTDSAKAIVKIYPGFTPNFNFAGRCYQNKFNFFNTTFAKYGVVDSVFWDFGEVSLNDDTSTLKNPSYKYLTPGNRTVVLYAHSSKGCEDTVSKVITVFDKPDIKLAFKDTLICSIDTLELRATTTGTAYTWSPNKYIVGTNTLNPLVFPKDTLKYILTATDNGCINRDTVTVNVLDFITVDAGANANVCLTDAYRLQPVSYATSYLWTPSATLDDSTKKYTLAKPTQPITKYYLTANLGKCQDKDSVTLFTFPYPTVKLSKDTGICYGDSVQILGAITGDVFSWNPKAGIFDTSKLNPFVSPVISTDYILTARYLTGCLKPRSDTIAINVVQPFTVYAGRDTAVVFGQPLQLYAAISDNTTKDFVWSSTPATNLAYLSNINFQNPIGTFPNTIDSITYTVKAYTKENCVNTDDIKITIFKTKPDIFVPTAFTPNGDRSNNSFKPIPVGITKLNYFNIYNRWGELLFTTSQIGKAWDGTVNGVLQDAGTFVFAVQGIDYTGKIITKKGTVVLIK